MIFICIWKSNERCRRASSVQNCTLHAYFYLQYWLQSHATIHCLHKSCLLNLKIFLYSYRLSSVIYYFYQYSLLHKSCLLNLKIFLYSYRLSSVIYYFYQYSLLHKSCLLNLKIFLYSYRLYSVIYYFYQYSLPSKLLILYCSHFNVNNVTPT